MIHHWGHLSHYRQICQSAASETNPGNHPVDKIKRWTKYMLKGGKGCILLINAYLDFFLETPKLPNSRWEVGKYLGHPEEPSSATTGTELMGARMVWARELKRTRSEYLMRETIKSKRKFTTSTREFIWATLRSRRWEIARWVSSSRQMCSSSQFQP